MLESEVACILRKTTCSIVFFLQEEAVLLISLECSIEGQIGHNVMLCPDNEIML